jgi:hypothetical protein
MGGERKLNSPVAIEGRGRHDETRGRSAKVLKPVKRRFRSLLDADDVENEKLKIKSCSSFESRSPLVSSARKVSFGPSSACHLYLCWWHCRQWFAQSYRCSSYLDGLGTFPFIPGLRMKWVFSSCSSSSIFISLYIIHPPSLRLAFAWLGLIC